LRINPRIALVARRVVVAMLSDVGSVVDPRAVHTVPALAEHAKSGSSQATECKSPEQTPASAMAAAIVGGDVGTASSGEVRSVVASVALIAV
jgi:hypothetical protein